MPRKPAVPPPDDVPAPKKVKRRIPWHTGHVGDGIPVKDDRPQAGRKKPPRPPKAKGRSQGQVSQKKKKGTPGRPRFQLTPELLVKIREAFEVGMSEEATALYAGIHYDTWGKYRETIISQTRDAFPTAEFKVRKSLLAQAQAGSIAHIQFSAKWLFGFVDTRRNELTGAAGGPVVTAPAVMSDDEIAARLQTMVDNAGSRKARSAE